MLQPSPTQCATDLTLAHTSGKCSLVGRPLPGLPPAPAAACASVCSRFFQSVPHPNQALAYTCGCWSLALPIPLYDPLHTYANGCCCLVQPGLPPALALMHTSYLVCWLVSWALPTSPVLTLIGRFYDLVLPCSLALASVCSGEWWSAVINVNDPRAGLPCSRYIGLTLFNNTWSVSLTFLQVSDLVIGLPRNPSSPQQSPLSHILISPSLNSQSQAHE